MSEEEEEKEEEEDCVSVAEGKLSSGIDDGDEGSEEVEEDADESEWLYAPRCSATFLTLCRIIWMRAGVNFFASFFFVFRVLSTILLRERDECSGEDFSFALSFRSRRGNESGDARSSS